MAWRNLWRNRRRTLITLSSMAFGVMLAVLFTGLGDHTYGKMIDLAARSGGGHVTLQHPDMLVTPSLKRTVIGASKLGDQALADPEVERVATRISGQALLATARQSLGATFIAFDPGREDASTLSVLDALVEGEMFASTDDKGIILGARLADSLDTKLGRKVVFTMTDKSGEIVSQLARVQGIIETGAPSVDRGLCLLPLGRVRKALGYDPDEATQVVVFLGDHRRSDVVAERVGAKVNHGTASLPWHQLQPTLAGFISMKVGGTVFMELVILVLVAAGIFNQLLVSVLERLREFGIMMAIGFSPGRLFRLVMWESLFLGVVGVVGGALLTAVPYYLGNTKGLDMSAMVGNADGGSPEIAGVALDPIMYVSIYPENAVLIAVVVIAATLLSGLYPAWRAGRVAPVDAIKLV
jgi:ABC-type lipoprotein release transport system permease subunit